MGKGSPASSARGPKGWLGLAAFGDKAQCNSIISQFPFRFFNSNSNQVQTCKICASLVKFNKIINSTRGMPTHCCSRAYYKIEIFYYMSDQIFFQLIF
jgi:hypothetical protein